MKKYTFLFAIFLSISLLWGIHTFSDASSTTPASNVSNSNDANDFWFLASPEWSSMIRPGILGGPKRTLYYVDTLWPVAGTDDSLFFVDLKYVFPGHTAANEKNIGCGYRQLILDDKLIVGGNFFYDTRWSENSVRHDQLGWGFEALTKWVDGRFNFYLPVSGNKFLGENVNYTFGNSGLLKHTSSSYEEPLPGLDYEAGVLIPFLSDFIETRAFCGGYHYFSDMGDNVNGIRGRMEIRPVPFFTIDVQVKDDNYIPTEAYIGAYISIPLSSIGNIFSKKKPFDDMGENPLGFGKGVRPLRERMTDVVIRDIDIVSQTSSTSTVTTTEHNVTYVDNSYAGGGSDGTLAKPYTAVQTGINNAFGDNWVYVKQGAGNYNENVNVANDVTLWGSGYDGGFAGIGAPGYPVVDGGGASVLSLSNNTTVMGLQIQNGGRGIRAREVTGISVHHNTITGNGNNGIYFRNNAGGSVTGSFHDNIITNDSKDGIRSDNTGSGTMTVHILNNTMTGNGRHGTYVENEGGGTLTAFINNNRITSSNNNGLSINNSNGSTMTATINNNTVTQSGSENLNVYNRDAGSSSTLTIDNNSFSSSTGDQGIRMRNNDATAILSAIIRNNMINSNDSRGLRLQNTDGTFNALLSGNTIANNGDDGIQLNDSSGTFDYDLGGGTQGSTGNNSIYGNLSGFDIDNRTKGAIMAENNWWGQTPPNAGRFNNTGAGTTDYTPWLTSDPN